MRDRELKLSPDWTEAGCLERQTLTWVAADH